MMRRNLKHGMWRGIAIGVGASSADVCYLLLMLFGLLPLLKTAHILHVIGVLGALLLIWFAYKAIRAPKPQTESNDNDKSILHCLSSGYLVALLSPFNIVFWISMATQLGNILGQSTLLDYFLACVGFFCGTALWFVTLNIIVHHTRHYLGGKVSRALNIIGGVVLIGFAVYTLGYIFF